MIGRPLRPETECRTCQREDNALLSFEDKQQSVIHDGYPSMVEVSLLMLLVGCKMWLQLRARSTFLIPVYQLR